MSTTTQSKVVRCYQCLHWNLEKAACDIVMEQRSLTDTACEYGKGCNARRHRFTYGDLAWWIRAGNRTPVFVIGPSRTGKRIYIRHGYFNKVFVKPETLVPRKRGDDER